MARSGDSRTGTGSGGRWAAPAGRPAQAQRSSARSRQAVTVGGVLAMLDELAPLACAAEWDNVGLLAGRPEWPVERALVAIDLTDAVAEEALAKQVDALVLYHPPIFRELRRITPDADGPTRWLPDLLAARIALLAVHTALDAAPGGTNDLLLDAFDTLSRRPLEPVVAATGRYKLVVFVLPAEADRLRTALSAAGAGVIGHYSECSFALAGRGTFRGDETTHPVVGAKLMLEQVEEIRLEMVVPQRRLAEVVRALYAHHSYEEPAFDLYPVHELAGRAAAGMGRIAELKQPTAGDALLRQLAQRVDVSCTQVVGELRRPFRAVIAAAGAFGVRGFRDPGALVLTGELKHHAALELQRRGVTAICLGHYASEEPVLGLLRARLAERLRGAKFAVAQAGRSPFAPARVP